MRVLRVRLFLFCYMTRRVDDTFITSKSVRVHESPLAIPFSSLPRDTPASSPPPPPPHSLTSARTHPARLGCQMNDFDDLSGAQELALGELVAEKFGSDFFFLDRFPTQIRPFYTMPCPDDSRYFVI